MPLLVFPLFALGLLGGCRETGDADPSPGGEPTVGRAPEREQMVREQIEARGIRDAAVLAALRKVPRHVFVPAALRSAAYADHPLPIEEEQTISQPYIVALMTELAHLGPQSKVLEIGTGSGYQAAVLAEIVGGASVYTIEIRPALADQSRALLTRLGYTDIHVRAGDGYQGWPEAAPFDAIVVTAAPARVPEPLLTQLKVGGRLVIPVGRWDQELMVYTRTPNGVNEESIAPVRFVPMTGRAQERR